jgi:hypothetical protein
MLKRLGDDTLARKRCVTVDADGHRRILVASLGSREERLSCACDALKHRVRNLEVTRIRNQRHSHFLIANFALSSETEVVLHVTGFTLGVGVGVPAFEFAEDRLVRFAEHVRENVDASAMGHRDSYFARAVLACCFDSGIEHRDHHVDSLDRESLVALICPSEESAPIRRLR